MHSPALRSTLGHNHPRLVEAIAKQAAERHPYLEHLSHPAAGSTGRSACCTGADGPGVFLQLGLRGERGIDQARPSIWSSRASTSLRSLSWISRSTVEPLATLSATGNCKVQVAFEPLVTGFVRVP